MEDLAGALGFNLGMAVPKTAALPLGYAPKLCCFLSKSNFYITFDKIHQHLFNFLFDIFNAFFAGRIELKYITRVEPEPVILTNSAFFQLISSFFNSLSLGYILNALSSRSFFPNKINFLLVVF